MRIRTSGGGLTCTITAGRAETVKVVVDGSLSLNACGLQACSLQIVGYKHNFIVCGRCLAYKHCFARTFPFPTAMQASRYSIEGTGTVAGAITATEVVESAISGTMQLAVAGGAQVVRQQSGMQHEAHAIALHWRGFALRKPATSYRVAVIASLNHPLCHVTAGTGGQTAQITSLPVCPAPFANVQCDTAAPLAVTAHNLRC